MPKIERRDTKFGYGFIVSRELKDGRHIASFPTVEQKRELPKALFLGLRAIYSPKAGMWNA